MAAQFQESRPPSQADTTVKVSLDEWAIVRRDAGVELMTDGLSGCVAIGIRTGDKLALTHVYSDAIDHFDDYRGQLGTFAESVGSKAEITEVHIMHNGNPLSQKHGTHLQGMIEDHLVHSRLVNPGVVHRHVDNGCTVADTGFYGKQDDNKALYVGGYTNTLLEGAPEAIAQRLEHAIERGGFKGSTGYRGPADIESRVRDGASEAHTSFARYVPNPHRHAPPSDQPSPADPSPSPPSGRDVIFDAVVKPIRESKLFGMGASPIARSIAEQVAETGATGVANLMISADGKHIGVVTHDRRDLDFTISGKVATLVSPSSTHASVVPSSVPPSPDPQSSSMPSSSVPSSSVPAPSMQPPSLYEQALVALAPHRDALKLGSDEQHSLAAREIASLANQAGLTGISRIERTVGGQGEPALVAQQDGPATKTSPPMAIDTLQQQVGVAAPTQASPGPDKPHIPNH